MSEENKNNQPDEIQDVEEQPAHEEQTEEDTSGGFFNRRNGLIALGIVSILAVGLALLITVSYKYGVFDNYIKQQFVTTMADIGVVFDADVFRLTVNPLELELKNATFNDKKTGEKLFRIGEAHLKLTVQNLYARQLSRDISIDTTDLRDVEVWVRFDENGNSNFDNLNLVQDEAGSAVNLKYQSLKFSLKDGLIHFGDVSRKISADAKNLQLFFEPENYDVPDEEKRYKFDFASTDSVVVYDEKPIDPINIRATGLLFNKGAELTQLKLTSPIAESTLSGSLRDWAAPKYQLKIDSSVDLTQTSNVLPTGATLRGIGNLKGTVVGEGENYKVVADIQSDSLAADNIRLKGVNVAATVEGKNSMYEANGKAIAEMLTFEDFEISFPQIAGNIRGTGTDFRWVGELQAAAAKSPLGTIAGLYITDAVAEYKDEKLAATIGNLRSRSFSADAANGSSINAGNVNILYADGRTQVNIPNVQAGVLNAQGTTLKGVNAGNIKITNQGETTKATAGSLRAASIETEDVRLRNLRTGNVTVNSRGATTNIEVAQVNADGLDANAAKVGAINASGIDVQIVGDKTNVYANNLKVAKVDTDAAILGSLNVAGVRLTILNGRIEARTDDVNVGDVTLTKAALPEGGKIQNVKLSKPVFVLEPSGQYRASADMSLGGGVLGSVKLGAARASVVAENDSVALNNLTANVVDGEIRGDATVALSDRKSSRINVGFDILDLSKLLALTGGQVVPINGNTTGQANLTFPGTNFKVASGTLNADITAEAGTDDSGFVPVNGKVALNATRGLFDIENANLRTNQTQLNATGSFDLNGYNSNLNVALNSDEAGEIERIIRVLNVSPELEQQLDTYDVDLAGNLNFNGNITGNLTNPTLDGKFSLESLILRGSNLGTLSSSVFVSPEEIALREGLLQERDGGNLAFNVNVPLEGTDNISIDAKLNSLNTGNLIAALPVDILPGQLKDFQAQTSGTVNVSGIPNNLQGSADISSGAGTINGEPFDGFNAKANFNGTLVNLEEFQAKFGDGFLRANGTYETDSTIFDFDVQGKDIKVARVRPFIPGGESLSDLSGIINLNAKAVGNASEPKTYNINFNGSGREIVYGENGLGEITFNGVTENQILNANVTAKIGEQPQVLNASLNFGDENLPLQVETTFNNTELAPYLALADLGVPVSGQATGRVFLQGNLYTLKADGTREFSIDNLSGAANLSQLALRIDETPLAATEPVAVRFNSKEVIVDSAKFAGGGSNIVVTGTKALTADGMNNLAIDGKINLRLLDAVTGKNTFFTGLADVAVRLSGTNANSRLNGQATLDNASVATFIGSERLTLTRVKGRVLFNSNQAQIDNLTGFLGGGRISASGGALLGDDLNLQRIRLDIRGNNFTAPLPPDFITTGDADIQISGYRDEAGIFNSLIAGTVITKRTIYNKDIDIADIISGRGGGSLSASSGSTTTDPSESFLGVPKLDIRIEARNSLIVRNNLADLTGSANLRVTGDIDYPQISGRVTADRGTIFFRKERYEIQRAIVEFPPNTSIEPYVNLQASTEINGYEIIVSLVGELNNTETLNAQLRSSPALPQADVISLITTGDLANTDGGIPTLAQSGVNTAAEILADELINNPLSKATDKLFGLNKFEINPIVSGQRLNPSARLTVGRQINRNLLITYSTNLSEDQNQVIALEYRVSNRLSFVAQYEQRPLSNVTRDPNVFSFEVRLRKRF